MRVVRNDRIDIAGIKALNPARIVLSPGPCTPDEAGVCLEAVERFAGEIPMLGVCLGQQVIGQIYGAKVTNAIEIKHGKTSNVLHNHTPLFRGLASPFTATRYHSLILDYASIPEELEITAWCNSANGEKQIMAISHQTLPLYGVQFHPESLLTEGGHQILKNFLELTK